MRRASLLVLGSAVLLAAAGLGAYAFGWFAEPDRITADPADPQLVALGRTVYDAHCASCHGRNLEGEPNWRQPLAAGGLPAPPHDATGHTWHHPDQLLFDYTKKGGAALAPADFQSNMPGFAGVLEDREIWAVLAFIKSRWPEEVQVRQDMMNARSR